MSCWLLKTEPTCFSIEDLARSPGQTTVWDGVRNYQARNFIRDRMRPGDPVLFYHSVVNPGIAGLAEITSLAYPDPSQWDPEDAHYDPRSSKEAPLWYAVDVHLTHVFKKPLALAMLRGQAALTGMELLRRGSRLSVQPVSPEHYAVVLDLAAAL